MTTRLSPTTRFAVVAMGGVGGALLRAGISELVPYDAGHFPTSLLLTQAIGCGLAGFLTPYLLRRGPLWSLAFLTGALASFTTFGLFTGQVILLAPQRLATAVVYLLATVLVGVAAAVAGLHLAMRLIERPVRADRPGGSGGPRSAVRRQASTGTHPVQSRDPREHTSPVRAARPRWRR